MVELDWMIGARYAGAKRFSCCVNAQEFSDFFAPVS